jgi:RNAse (barnase) inhibitor barstar
MNETEFNEKYLAVTNSQRPILIRFLRGDSDDEISIELGSTKENIRQHISKICQLFKITDQQVEGKRLREGLIKEFKKYKPELIGKKWLNELSCQEFLTNFPYPSGALALNSLLYTERKSSETVMRQSVESEIKAAIIEPRALIRIVAPSKFGKTSLLLRIEDYAKNQNFRAAYINIKQEFDRDMLEDRANFMRHFCVLISDRLDSSLDIVWQDRHTPQMNCTRHVETLLNLVDDPIILILDGVEVFYTADLINQEFFQMLRRWHDNGASKDSWLKIRQVIAYSSDNYGAIDLARSPFNIGRYYELADFNESDILKITQKIQLDWDITQVKQLMLLIGGHPYLVNIAIYHFFTYRDLTLEQFLSKPSIDTIYQSHLDSLTNYLEGNTELKITLKWIIGPQEKEIMLENRLKHILYGLGVIKYLNSEIKIRCELYREHFQKYFRLQSDS